MTLDSGHPLMGAVAAGLAGAGFDLVLHATRVTQTLRDTARRIERSGRRVLIVSGHSGRPDELRAWLSQVDERFGRLDVLVTRGMNDTDDLALAHETASPESDALGRVWTPPPSRQEVEAALRSPFFAIQGAVPLLAANGGAVVNVVDRDGGQTSNEALVYLTRLMARELRPRVRVNAVTVGAVDGTGRETVPEERAPGPLGDYASWAPDLTRAVLFLLGAPYLNGEVMRVGATPTG